MIEGNGAGGEKAAPAARRGPVPAFVRRKGFRLHARHGDVVQRSDHHRVRADAAEQIPGAQPERTGADTPFMERHVICAEPCGVTTKTPSLLPAPFRVPAVRISFSRHDG